MGRIDDMLLLLRAYEGEHLIRNHLEAKSGELSSARDFVVLNKTYHELVGYCRCMRHAGILTREKWTLLQDIVDKIRDERQHSLIKETAR